MSDYVPDYMKNLSSNFPYFAILKMVVSTAELSEKYRLHIEEHNRKIFIDGPFANSGFDLFVPEETTIPSGMTNKMISMGVKCEMLFQGEIPCGYYMYPRSSISKTPLMLANHIGIIDAGYRGSLIGAFRNLGPDYTVESYTRLLQVCHPLLCPIYVVIVQEDELSSTIRAEGGFGSTGK